MTTTTTPVYVSTQVFKAKQIVTLVYGDMATASVFCSQYSDLLEATITLLCPGFTMANKNTFKMENDVRLAMEKVLKYLDMVLESVDIENDDTRSIQVRVALSALSSFWDTMIKIHILNNCL